MTSEPFGPAGDGRSRREPILMLVPHEPLDDPRVGWVTRLCAEIGHTDVLAATWSTQRQAREYDGTLYVERVNLNENATNRAKALATALGTLGVLGPADRYARREGRPPGATGRDPLRRTAKIADHHVGATSRFLASLGWLNLIADALRQRSRAVSIRPRVVVCHDLSALIPAVALKRMYGCPVLYDAHEYWPEADLLARPWQRRLTARVERSFIRDADVVVTVTPHLARELERRYGTEDVIAVPNAEPVQPGVVPASDRRLARPVKFLYQGQVAAGRGIGALVEAWGRAELDGAVLYLRCPENEYLRDLRARFAAALARGIVVLLPPVEAHELVQGAAFADVGVIPYVGPNLNHVYACPNKLSQYMQAGLAILSARLEFVRGVIERFGCGLTFDPGQPASLVETARRLVQDREMLQRMKDASRQAAVSEFNWDVQSKPYRTALETLYRGARP